MSDCTCRVRNHFDSQVHFQPSDAHPFFAFLHPLGVGLGVLGLLGVSVNAHFVAKLAAANHRVDRCAVPDQGGQPISIKETTFQSGELKLNVEAISRALLDEAVPVTEVAVAEVALASFDELLGGNPTGVTQ